LLESHVSDYALGR